MSTRKHTQTPTSLVGGTTLSKVDNVTTNVIDTTTTTTASVINVELAEVSLGKGEMGKTASSINPNSDKAELEYTIASSKSIQTRVTRSSPLLLNSPTNKKDQANALLELNELNNSESDEVSSAAPKRINQIRGRKSLKEIKELKEQQQQDKDDLKEEHHDQKELKEINETKANAKELKEAADPGTSASTSGNRLTRKSFSHNSSISVNTRVTRQRHTNPQTGSRSETPPARHKLTRASGRSKMSLTSASSSESSICKGKRSLDTRCYSTEEPLIKCIKTEAKDELDDEDEEFLSTSQTTVTSSESAVGGTPVKFKQELAEESENESEHVVVTEASNSSAGTPSSGRSRYSKSGGGRKANNTGGGAISLSPNTRLTRQTKASSPAASTITTESAKRPRVTSNSRSLLKSNVGANSSKRQRASSHLIDEDELSKDGSISSSTTDDIALSSIKTEVPFTSELSRIENDAVISESYKESEAEEKSGTVDTDADIIHLEVDVDDDGLSVPTTNTSTVPSPSLSAVSSKSKKNFPLSPADLMREGINASEVNVKQFYKKEEFLDNNVNLEEDPKLDSILAQEVSTMDVDTLPELGEAINPDDSLKEGSLRFEEEESPDKKLLSQQKLTSSLLNEDENNSSLNFHPEEEYNLIDNDEPVLIINEDNVPEEELNGAKDDEFQDEEVTIDESECISMDNNASVNNDLTGAPFDDETDENFVTSKNEEAKDESTDVIRSRKPSENFGNNVLDAELEKLDGRSKEKPSKRRKTDETNNKIHKSDNKINNMELSEMKFDKFPLSVAVVKAETFEMAEEKDKRLIKIDDDDQEGHTQTKTRSGIKSKDSDNVSLKCKNSDERNSWAPLNMEHDEETLREKERHLQHLGLVTHKAAEKRRIEVQQSSAANVEASKAAVAAATVQQPQSHYSKRNGKNNATHTANNNSITNNNNNNNNTTNGTSITSHPEYTGTLKTVIKLSRNSTGYAANGTTNRRKSPQTNSTSGAAIIGTAKEHHMQQQQQQQQQHRRQSLKMTFQKGRGRPPGTSNHDRYHHDSDRHGEDSYYTIQNENEETNNQHNTHSLAKTNTIISTNNNNNNNKLVEQEEILIPEKASSFKFHPGRLCEDQCFYCSGTFGLYDTPCHVGQIKSKERQQKILASEEKLTVDNCLCDACFRHVDRRANVPSYRKRISAPDNMGPSTSAAAALRAANETQGNANENNGTESTQASAAHKNDTEDNARECMVNDCKEASTHSLRRKCLRKNAKKFLLNFEMPATAAILWLCQTHYDAATRGLACVLCKRRLAKHYMYRVSDIDRLEKTLADMGIPVKLGSSRATCKLCRYFANLLTKPTAANKSTEKAEFIQNYRKRLLQFHNIHVDSNEPSEADEEDSNSAGVVEVPVTNITQKSPLAAKPLTAPEDDSSATKDSLTPQESVNSMEIERNGNDAAAPARSTLSVENTTEETMDRDYECTALNNDSSSNQSMDTSTKHSAATPTDTQQMSKLKAILQSNTTATTVNAHTPGEKSNSSADISTVLRANPNLSMRELFPGEEDLGLHFKVPFGTSNSQRTPEGWTRVDTFLQYDEPTRRLWEELQKPYGNQSSFLRHLILLEKYYRNGDLILSPNASSNASVYTQTVRQRLTSFDQGHCGGLQEAAAPIDASPTTTTQTAGKARTCEPEIPTVEINEDDDDMEVNNANDEDADDDDDDVVETLDVEMTRVQKLSTSTSALPETKSKKHQQQQQQQQQIQRSRSLSVDKLTKQLNTQAVTIIARPKEQTTHSGGGGGSKRTTPSPQKSLLKDNLVTPAVTSICSTAQPNSTAAPNGAAVAVTCSTSTANSSNSRSILKCNLLGINKSVEIVPVNTNGTNTPVTCTATATTAPKAVPNLTPATNINTYLPAPPTMEMPKQHDLILGAAKKLVEAAVAQTKTNPTNNAPNLLSSPPELVSLQRRTTNQPVTIASSRNSSNSNTNTNNPNKRSHVIGKVVILPDTLTPQERMQSKSWRPTLMPVKDNQNLFSKNGPLYQTADGRRLPGLVQVQSGGKPFLISIFDYNRMCILRREKLMRDQMLKATKKRQEDKKHQQQTQTQNQQQHQQQQQQQQQSHHHQQMAKSGLHHMNKNTSNQANLVAVTNRQQQQQQQHQQQVAQQQLLQLQLLQHQQALLKAAGSNNAINVSGGLNVTRYQPIAPKQPNTATTSVSATSVTGPTINTVVNVPPLSTSATFPTPMIPLLANAITNATNNCTSWLWNNFPDANQLLLNGVAGTAGGNVTVGGVGGTTSASMPKLPHLLTNKSTTAVITTSAAAASFTHANAIKQQQQQQQQQFLLSKIPKSLTVIPQHKLMNAPVSNATLGANINTANGNQIKE